MIEGVASIFAAKVHQLRFLYRDLDQFARLVLDRVAFPSTWLRIAPIRRLLIWHVVAHLGRILVLFALSAAFAMGSCIAYELLLVLGKGTMAGVSTNLSGIAHSSLTLSSLL